MTFFSPETIFLSLSTPDGKRKETDQSEIDEVYEKGYMKAVGGLLWSARCTAPQTTLGINYLQRVMSQPTHEAFKAAMHMIKYLYENRHQGICFNENGEKTLRVYYDSSNKGDYTDGNEELLIMIRPPPVNWLGSSEYSIELIEISDRGFSVHARTCSNRKIAKGVARVRERQGVL